MSAIHAMKSAALDVGTRRGFSAQYGGACISCSSAILPGDKIFYAPGGEAASGLDCCGDRPDEDLIVLQRAETDVDEEVPAVAIARVMPRGRTKADMCGACFQIRSSNNTCGC